MNKPLVMQVGLLKRILSIANPTEQDFEFIPPLSNDHTSESDQMMSLYRDSDPQFSFHLDNQVLKSEVISSESSINQQFFICKSQPSCIVVRRIPFIHLSQLQPILSILRQQIVHQQLLKSCFTASHVHKGDTSSSEPIQHSSKKRKRNEESSPSPNEEVEQSNEHVNPPVTIELESTTDGSAIQWRLFSVLPNAQKTPLTCTFIVLENGKVEVKVGDELKESYRQSKSIPQVLEQILSEILKE